MWAYFFSSRYYDADGEQMLYIPDRKFVLASAPYKGARRPGTTTSRPNVTAEGSLLDTTTSAKRETVSTTQVHFTPSSIVNNFLSCRPHGFSLCFNRHSEPHLETQPTP